jgi:glycosyltransferase involved in cell wall biosynthesis
MTAQRRVAVLGVTPLSGETGGAERLFGGLRDALEREGLATELVMVPSDEASFTGILEAYLRCYDLDLSGFDAVLSTKAPTYAVQHRNHVCYLMHTMRVFYDMFVVERPQASAEDVRQRALIQRLDRMLLRPPRVRRLLTIGEEVRQRILPVVGLEADVLRHPSTLDPLREGAFRHLLLPGRLHRWKRADLAIAAMRQVRPDIPLLITGTGEDAAVLQREARGDPRIRFIGHVTDEQLLTLYAEALAVLFIPLREDLGLVTLEAFGSGKPVITCTDSGEPARLIAHGHSGLICPPEPGSLAAAIEFLAANPARAAEMGREGRVTASSITWDKVAERLTGAILGGLPAFMQAGTRCASR